MLLAPRIPISVSAVLPNCTRILIDLKYSRTIFHDQSIDKKM